MIYDRVYIPFLAPSFMFQVFLSWNRLFFFSLDLGRMQTMLYWGCMPRGTSSSQIPILLSCLFFDHTGPKPPSPSLLSHEKPFVACATKAKSKKGTPFVIIISSF